MEPNTNLDLLRFPRFRSTSSGLRNLPVFGNLILQTKYKMSSVGSFFSQVAPFKRYIVNTTAAQTGLIYDSAGANGVAVAADVVLRDMGKTVIITAGGGTPLRKVQILPVSASNTTPAEYGTGYIYLENVPFGQNITTLN